MISDSSFPKSRRLLKRLDFMRVLKNGRRISDSQLSFAVLPNNSGQARLGMAIAKRSIPRAVDRNTIRRQLREVFRQFPGLPELDMVVLTRRSTKARDPQAVRASAFSLLQKITDKESITAQSQSANPGK